MLLSAPSGRFKRDVKRAAKRGKNLGKLTETIDLLLAGQPLPASYKDHALHGNWQGWRDLHIEPDWLLLYRIDGEKLLLARTGSHADLFDK